MSIDERIRNALLPFGIPVENTVYQGKEKRYYTFQYSSVGEDFGDDAPSHERFLVQIHLFAPLSENITKLIKKAKRALAAAGFTWPEVTNADDEDGHHRVFECEASEGIDLDG